MTRITVKILAVTVVMETKVTLGLTAVLMALTTMLKITPLIERWQNPTQMKTSITERTYVKKIIKELTTNYLLTC